MGVVFGAIIVYSQRDEGLEIISVPVVQLGVFFVLALVIGVLAAVLPARRAARLDVLKAIALGAHAVLIGRPAVYGLAAQGAEGVTRVINILRRELEMAMALSGRPTIKALDASVIWK